MSNIFTNWQLGKLTIPNRLVRSATWEGMAESDGTPTIEIAMLSANLAQGGVGLIIAGCAFIHPLGRGLPYQTGAHIDAMIGPLTRISDAVHKKGGLVAIQIAHAGGQTKSKWIGDKPFAPSAGEHLAFKEQLRQLTKTQIDDIVNMFAKAAYRVKFAGFDAIELHGAHGYLISEFLSPITNKRLDEYGGSIENRSRFCCEVYLAVRREVGADYPIFIKLNSEDGLEGGIELGDVINLVNQLSKIGIDAIEISGGMAAANKRSAVRTVINREGEGYFFENAKNIKNFVHCPIIVVGGWRSKNFVEKALNYVDAVAMSRPFICQPNLANLWRLDKNEISACISCNQCMHVAMNGGGIFCVESQKKLQSVSF